MDRALLQTVVDAMQSSAAKLSESDQFIASVSVELIESWAAGIQAEIDRPEAPADDGGLRSALEKIAQRCLVENGKRRYRSSLECAEIARQALASSFTFNALADDHSAKLSFAALIADELIPEDAERYATEAERMSDWWVARDAVLTAIERQGGHGGAAE